MVSVVSEEVIPPPSSVLEHKEGYIGRMITLHVERTIWSNGEDAPVNSDFNVISSGWLLKGEERIPFAMGAGVRMEVGERYLFSLVLYERGWGPLSVGAVVPVEGNTVPAEFPPSTPSRRSSSARRCKRFRTCFKMRNVPPRIPHELGPPMAQALCI